ncbi:hypothetical protein [Marinobacter fonticola]|uniref:hypothetical protein n=1 Tax=Marinobacter fonticola TaxID=2603215 RepID=UPI0011E72F0A|nr:hypothetical protein [Marinobacter fonticola]
MQNERSAIRLSGLEHRLNYTEYDWPSITGAQLETPQGIWRAGGNLNAARRLQEAALLAFNNSGEAIGNVKSDSDLTPEAKSRRVLASAEQYFNSVAPVVSELSNGMASLAEAAPRMLSAVKPLKETDVVGELRDQELRSFLRTLGPGERQKLVLAMGKGEHSELTAAVLRGPSIVSGLTDDTVKSLNRAGIATSYRDSVTALHTLLMVRDDVIRTAIAGADLLGQIHNSAKSTAVRAKAWKADEGADTLREWLNDFRMLQAA